MLNWISVVDFTKPFSECTLLFLYEKHEWYLLIFIPCFPIVNYSGNFYFMNNTWLEIQKLFVQKILL